MDLDTQVRLAAFGWLSDRATIVGDVLSRDMLETGFPFQGQRMPLVSPQGIFKPKILEIPLSITTTPEGPYDDSFDKDDFLLYRYRGTDPDHRDNVGLRLAFNRRRPLIYFHGVTRGRYLAVWPVYVISDDPAALCFKIAVDEFQNLLSDDQPAVIAENSDSRRAYLTSIVRVRLHQRSFPERVLDAYHSQCSFCRLRHRELLDAAHIVPDSERDSKPIVENGISLCKLHHAAFDGLFLAVSPDYRIVVREDILEEEDGPGLQHGLKDLHGLTIMLPHRKEFWPKREFLEWRFDRFSKAAS